MNEKSKAKELVDKYLSQNIVMLGCGKDEGNPCIISGSMTLNSAKECAKIAVNEILVHEKDNYSVLGKLYDYWSEVLKEIDNI